MTFESDVRIGLVPATRSIDPKCLYPIKPEHISKRMHGNMKFVDMMALTKFKLIRNQNRT